jgi:hypothetical protein
VRVSFYPHTHPHIYDDLTLVRFTKMMRWTWISASLGRPRQGIVKLRDKARRERLVSQNWARVIDLRYLNEQKRDSSVSLATEHGTHCRAPRGIARPEARAVAVVP